eukprot:CCRYP_012133-RA/>CCRYP_012133-RA protein AED:0.41 eAED:0.41 QI:368/1/0.5/1/0/0/2/0/84
MLHNNNSLLRLNSLEICHPQMETAPTQMNVRQTMTYDAQMEKMHHLSCHFLLLRSSYVQHRRKWHQYMIHTEIRNEGFSFRALP